MNDDGELARVGDLQALVQRWTKHLQAEGITHTSIAPANPKSKGMVTQHWAKEWMRQLAESEVYGNRLAPGRTALRHGCVLDLCITESHIRALVADEYLCEVEIRIKPLEPEQKEALRLQCAGKISSWLALLSAKLSPDLLALLTAPETGIVPTYSEWRFSCNCTDYATPCRHAAAALYAAALVLDTQPQLLFTLRGIMPSDLIPLPTDTATPCHIPTLPTNALGSIFCIDIS